MYSCFGGSKTSPNFCTCEPQNATSYFSEDWESIIVRYPFPLELKLDPSEWKIPSEKFCSLWINSSSLAMLGDIPLCQIAEDRPNEVKIWLGNSPTILPFQNITLLPKVLYTKNCSIP
eukprot:TRINITY_DN24260_c0_g1_i1.p1 TRINITY_DN24260_c0_g1~~TRINITY_DN24260_c0_g1_i1.p1  ORF type:complete len:118 (+),score=8.61 TRINITY_DN24260_c0_g1_i1:215-568(+)